MKKCKFNSVGKPLLPLLIYTAAWLLPDIIVALISRPDTAVGFVLTVFWALVFALITMMLPKLAGRIFFGVFYAVCVAWSLIQSGYHCVFGKLMWIRDFFYVSEGVGFLGDTLRTLPPLWWICGVLVIGLWLLLIWKFPRRQIPVIPGIAAAAAAIAIIFLVPNLFFGRAYKSAYNKLPNAKSSYSVCGLYQLTVRDIWDHVIRNRSHDEEKKKDPGVVEEDELGDYFAARKSHESNAMTGRYVGKNVVLVLMESMDDFLITQEETPNIYRLMDEGINFTQFYTPGYGTARTLNTEFCMNTGIYLPTEGAYVFDYLDNGFNQSLASQLVDLGYTAEVFHYNTPDFYSRGELEPAVGYGAYHSYGDYLDPEDESQIYSDCMLFDVQALRDRFFREGKTLNTIITRSAHLGYSYEEELSAYALSVYPEYREKYPNEEEACIRAKAKLVDDMFGRLLSELETGELLQDTVIIGITDHYAYGMENDELLMRLSGVEQPLMLERTPCFVWSAEGEDVEVDKTLATVDFLPTVLNLLGVESAYPHLGHDAFDEAYPGYVIFPDGSWFKDGIACRIKVNGEPEILVNLTGNEVAPEDAQTMAETAQTFIRINNLLLEKDYYK